MTPTAPHAYSPIGLTALAQELLEEARDPASRSGRAARTVVGGRDAHLRQTIVALKAEAKLNDHESPGEATLYVLEGDISLTVGDHGTRLVAGEIMEIPLMRHGLVAHADSVVLLSVSAHTRPATTD
ncbi:MAG TPA: LuxR family transcriptional regulator [Actinomycetales bacterium]|nr:LuxR family transcriptional regulator [Actinomycetales bacterium]